MYQSSVLLIDSSIETLNLLSLNFQREGARVKTFHDALSAYQYLQNHPADIVVTDWLLSVLNGLELCKMMKRSIDLAHIPVVIMADRDSEIDAVTALEVGAEDYIRKPVPVRELLARVKKIIQRNQESAGYARMAQLAQPGPSARASHSSRDIIQFREIALDTSRHKAYLQEREIMLTYSEFRLLELFLSNPERVYQRNSIIEKISGIDYYATERSVDVLVVGLRKKLGEFKKYVETVRGVGYRLSDRAS